MILSVVGNKKQAGKTIKNKDGKLLLGDVQLTNRWKENPKRLCDRENLYNWKIREEQTTLTILRSEFNTGLSELKSNKAPIIYFILAELLQNSNQILNSMLYKISLETYPKMKKSLMIIGDYPQKTKSKHL